MKNDLWQTGGAVPLRASVVACMVWSSILVVCPVMADEKIVIAHRGASGYLPEHTLPAKALAYGQGADYIEQDVVLTQDDVPIVLHDIHLDTVTNVQRVFPDRARGDGRFYAIDFTLAEIRKLRVHERRDLKTGKPVYAGRFPSDRGDFRVPSLAEEIELIQGLNQSTGKQVGLYPEIKKPAFHRQAGKDISRIVLDLLKRYSLSDAQDRIYLQCFDPDETQRIRSELGSQLRIVQLIGKNEWREANCDFDQMRTPEGLRRIATYADGVGPSIDHVVIGIDSSGQPRLSPFVADAHAAGLVVHPYTFRSDALPSFAPDAPWLLRVLWQNANVDGLFSDFPDKAVQSRRRLE